MDSQPKEPSLNIDAGKKPHVCEICDKGFSEKYKMNNHCRAHIGENILFWNYSPIIFCKITI